MLGMAEAGIVDAAHRAGVTGSSALHVISRTRVVSPARTAAHERCGHGAGRNRAMVGDGRETGWCPVQAFRHGDTAASPPSSGYCVPTRQKRRGGSNMRHTSISSAPPIQPEPRQLHCALLMGPHLELPIIGGAISRNGGGARTDVAAATTRSSHALLSLSAPPAPLVAGIRLAAVGAAEATRECGLQLVRDPSSVRPDDIEGSMTSGRV